MLKGSATLKELEELSEREQLNCINTSLNGVLEFEDESIQNISKFLNLLLLMDMLSLFRLLFYFFSKGVIHMI